MLQSSLEHRDGLAVFLSKFHLHVSWEGKHFSRPDADGETPKKITGLKG